MRWKPSWNSRRAPRTNLSHLLSNTLRGFAKPCSARLAPQRHVSIFDVLHHWTESAQGKSWLCIAADLLSTICLRVATRASARHHLVLLSGQLLVASRGKRGHSLYVCGNRNGGVSPGCHCAIIWIRAAPMLRIASETMWPLQNWRTTKPSGMEYPKREEARKTRQARAEDRQRRQVQGA